MPQLTETDPSSPDPIMVTHLAPDNVEEPAQGRSVGLSGWLWVPTLYFAESIPNAVVSDTAKFLYNDMGLTPERLGVITGSMYLPWVLKPLWSPFIDLVKTKRWWICMTQLLLAACFLLLAGAIRTDNWLLGSAAALWGLAIISATHDIAADGFYMLGLKERDQAGLTGVRATAYRLAMLFAKGRMVALAGHLTLTMTKPESWSLVMCVPGALYVFFALYHFVTLPKPWADKPVVSENFGTGYAASFASFFAKPKIKMAIAFMLLFRFAEAQLLAMVAPFLTNARDAGGLALTTEQVGNAYGTFGVLGIIFGGILAGLAVSRFGLRRLYWKLIIIMHLPNLAFLYLAFCQPTNVDFISACLFVEQFGYGFGFTAYMLYLMYFSRGPQRTSHYAICTGFMALSLMIPQMFSGFVKASLGFQNFFLYILVCTIPSFWVAWLAWKDEGFVDYFPAKKG